MDNMTLKRICLVEVVVHSTKKSSKSKQSIFLLAFQKQGLKQLYQMMAEVDKSCTKLTKDEGR